VIEVVLHAGLIDGEHVRAEFLPETVRAEGAQRHRDKTVERSQ
jgi:hypothetical protein